MQPVTVCHAACNHMSCSLRALLLPKAKLLARNHVSCSLYPCVMQPVTVCHAACTLLLPVCSLLLPKAEVLACNHMQ